MTTEIERIKSNVKQIPTYGVVDDIMVVCDYSLDFIERVKIVALNILENINHVDVDSDEWLSIIPVWFSQNFAQKKTSAEEEIWLKEWKSSSRVKQLQMENDLVWTLDEWLYWFTPDMRSWEWWSYQVVDDEHLFFRVWVDGIPYPKQALNILLTFCGALELQSGDY